MKPFIPHLILLAAVVLLVVLALTANSGVIGGYMGASLASMEDPPLIVIAAIIGAAFKRGTFVWLPLIVFGVVFAALIAHMNADLGARLDTMTVLSKCTAALLIGYIVNAVRVAASKATQRQ